MSRMNDRLAQNAIDPAPAEQVAALPLRWTADDTLEVLMVTSRDTGRWVMPKGWTEDGMTLSQAASLEASEEAGATGPISDRKIGEYRYCKLCDNGAVLQCRVRLFPMVVKELQSDWKEREERTRRWFSAEEAANRVDEPDLAELLRGLCNDPRNQPVIRDLLKTA